MLLLPSPRRLDNLLKRRMRCLPAQRSLQLFLASNQHRRITRTPRPEFAGNLAAGDSLRRINHFENRKAPAIADVEGFTGDAINFLKRAYMGIGDIQDVD